MLQLGWEPSLKATMELRDNMALHLGDYKRETTIGGCSNTFHQRDLQSGHLGMYPTLAEATTVPKQVKGTNKGCVPTERKPSPNHPHLLTCFTGLPVQQEPTGFWHYILEALKRWSPSLLAQTEAPWNRENPLCFPSPGL